MLSIKVYYYKLDIHGEAICICTHNGQLDESIAHFNTYKLIVGIL